MTNEKIRELIEKGDINTVKEYVRKVESEYLFHPYGDEVIYRLENFVREVCEENGMRGAI